MSSEVKSTQKKSTGMYWIGFVISLILTIAFLMLKPEWFWVMLPFLFTSFVLAKDWM